MYLALRFVATGSLALLLSACEADRDRPDRTDTLRRGEAVIDVREGAYRGIRLEASPNRLFALFGRGASFDPERDAATTLANPDGNDGAPAHIGVPSDAYAWSVHRYQHLVAFVANNRYVYTLLIDNPAAATTEGVGIGDSLERVEQVYENATCGVASGVAEEPDYPACSLELGPNRHVWFGEDPIESITLSVLLRDAVEPS